MPLEKDSDIPGASEHQHCQASRQENAIVLIQPFVKQNDEVRIGFRWTVRDLIANSQLELLCRKDPGDEQTLNETGFEPFRNKGNVFELRVGSEKLFNFE
ncbi:hypothetical protein BTVI_79090 [Pitangus sulphuratus]|nr:hypothetical protein BTVI_79090 [Pitangus sulphuratus]